MTKYLLARGKEGAEWKSVEVKVVGSLEEALAEFNKREKPYILWFLIDHGLFQSMGFTSLSSLFSALYAKHPNVVEMNYNFSPVVGFHDMIATSRNWGLLPEK